MSVSFQMFYIFISKPCHNLVEHPFPDFTVKNVKFTRTEQPAWGHATNKGKTWDGNCKWFDAKKDFPSMPLFSQYISSYMVHINFSTRGPSLLREGYCLKHTTGNVLRRNKCYLFKSQPIFLPLPTCQSSSQTGKCPHYFTTSVTHPS